MKPNPLSSLKNLTVPVGMVVPLQFCGEFDSPIKPIVRILSCYQWPATFQWYSHSLEISVIKVFLEKLSQVHHACLAG
jgi:hypothetical protein